MMKREGRSLANLLSLIFGIVIALGEIATFLYAARDFFFSSERIGLECIGIGSRVAFYYWPSALIREYIAIRMEMKHLALFLVGWALCVSICFVN